MFESQVRQPDFSPRTVGEGPGKFLSSQKIQIQKAPSLQHPAPRLQPQFPISSEFQTTICGGQGIQGARPLWFAGVMFPCNFPPRKMSPSLLFPPVTRFGKATRVSQGDPPFIPGGPPPGWPKIFVPGVFGMRKAKRKILWIGGDVGIVETFGDPLVVWDGMKV